jgi:Phage integrase, N-terminal SAM-like domain
LTCWEGPAGQASLPAVLGKTRRTADRGDDGNGGIIRSPQRAIVLPDHIHSCKRFAAFLKRSPDTATAEDIRRFQLHLSETGASICNRNRMMTGLRFLFRVTLRRLDLAAEIYHLREPQKIPLV